MQMTHSEQLNALSSVFGLVYPSNEDCSSELIRLP